MRIPEKVLQANTGSVFYDFEGASLLPAGPMDSLRHISPGI
jgi:hypothetical protein